MPYFGGFAGRSSCSGRQPARTLSGAWTSVSASSTGTNRGSFARWNVALCWKGDGASGEGLARPDARAVLRNVSAESVIASDRDSVLTTGGAPRACSNDHASAAKRDC